MSKRVKIAVITLSLVIILGLTFGAGYALGAITRPGVGEGLDSVEQVWNTIFRDYVDRDKLDSSKLSQGAIRGMVEALDDPYTSYLDAETYKLSMSSLTGKFDGIGARVGIKDGQLMIIAPIADSPAARAGIRAGDKVLEINGRSTSKMSLAEAVLTIRGPKGTSVRLVVLHQGETKSEEIEIIRAEIKLDSIRFEMRGDIAYINITHFSKRTADELSPVLQTIDQEQASGIILDLRSNAGGMLKSAVDVASYFLKQGIVVSVVDNQGRRTSLMAKPSKITSDLPLIVLVDGYTASGGEVLAGALQDHGRTTIAGTKTFGKGSVNVLRQLKDGSGLYITTARWLTPNGHLIEGKGLSPDHELELTGEDTILWAIDHLGENK